MTLILIILVLVLLCGGGGYAYSGPVGGGGGLGLVLVIVLILYLLGYPGRLMSHGLCQQGAKPVELWSWPALLIQRGKVVVTGNKRIVAAFLANGA